MRSRPIIRNYRVRAPVRTLLTMIALWGTLLASAPSVEAQLVSPALAQRALVEGSVPVIVHLALPSPMTAEGLLTDSAAVSTQRHGIASAQLSVLSALAGVGHRVRRQYETIPFIALELSPAAVAIINALTGVVLGVEEDILLAPMLAESTPIVQANAAWDAGFTGSGKVVAVLDTGVDKAHTFLSGKVVEEACYSANGNCPNGLTTQLGPGAGVPCAFAAFGCQHGTHVGGIAAGLGASFSGVARGASLMAVQVFSRFTGADCVGAGEDPCPRANYSDIIAGLERVYALRSSHAFAAVNMSLGGGQYFATCDSVLPSVKAAIDNLRSAGIATVISSGNSGFTNSMGAPACISTAVSVGSTQDGSLGTTVDAISSFSNSASFLSLLAPGQYVNSSIPGNLFANFQGTSMAAPHVAGAWAVLKQGKPSASVTEVLTVLQSTGLPITDPRNNITKSRIRILQALQALVPPTGDGFKTYTVAPCRIIDTRVAGGAIPGDGFRSFRATGALSGQGGASDCLIPFGPAKALHVNVVAVGPSGPGHLTVHPYPSPLPLASMINFSAGQTVANGVMVPICDPAAESCFFDFTVTMGPAASHIVVDVTGYLGPKP